MRVHAFLFPFLAVGGSALVASGCAAGLQTADEGGSALHVGSSSQRGVDDPSSQGPDAAELDEPEAEKVAIPGSDFVRGRARVVVHAPIEKVRATLFDFKNYPEFMPFWDQARIIGKRPDGSQEVYMSVKLLYGALRLWARLEMPKPKVVDGDEIVEEHYLDGNLKDLDVRWRVHAVDTARTELGVDVLMHPKVDLPLDMLNNGQLDGARMLVDSVRLRAEGRDPE